MSKRCMLLLLLVPLLVSVAEAQQDRRQAKDERIFFEPVEVPLVNVEVFVSDKDGRPIPGLTPDDFEVFEDGEPMDISHFYAAPGVITESASQEVGDEVATGPVIPLPDQRLYLVLFIDQTNIMLAERSAAINNLKLFLDQDLPEDLHLLLASFDGNLEVHQRFTREVGLIRNALDHIDMSVGTNDRMDKSMILNEIQRTPNFFGQGSSAGGGAASSTNVTVDPALIEEARIMVDGILQSIESYAAQKQYRTRRALEALKDFVRSLAGLEGRKAVFFVADDIEVNPGEDLLRLWARVYPGLVGVGSAARTNPTAFSVRKDLRRVIEFANTNRVSFYALGAGLERLLGNVSAEWKGFGSGTGSGIEFLNENTGGDAFTWLTSSTGGRKLQNNTSLGEQLDEVAEELASYYSLAYRPPSTEDGEYHSIKVKVTHDGAQVRHREGYIASTKTDRMVDRTLSAAIHRINDNPLGVAVEAHGIESREDGNFLVPVLIRVPLGQLVLLPQETSHEGRVAVFIAVSDSEGGLSDVQRREYPVHIPNEDLLTAITKEAGFTLGLLMREGEHAVAVGVRDELASVESIVVVDVEVAPEAVATDA